MKKNLQYTASDILVSIVVLLIGLPLCLGIALGSGAPLFSGIIAGIVGGIVVGILSGSQLSVSGPAAALTGIVVVGIGKLGSFEAFLVTVVLAGILQVVFGYLKAGVIAHFVPNAVIKGMVTAIGLILILKQVPHFLGYDADFEGDEGFLQNDQHNTFTEILYAFNAINTPALIVGLVCLFTLLIWQRNLLKKNNFLARLPGPLLAVIIALALSYFMPLIGSDFVIAESHLVNLPVAKNLPDFFTFFTFPDFKYLLNPTVWVTAFSLAVIASLETLLAVEAVDKLDPLKRITPTNQELKAQ